MSIKKLEELRQSYDYQNFVEDYSLRGSFHKLSPPTSLFSSVSVPNSKNQEKRSLRVFLKNDSIHLDLFLNIRKLSAEDRLLLGEADSCFVLPEAKNLYFLADFSKNQKLTLEDNFPFNNSYLTLESIILPFAKNSLDPQDYGAAGDCQVNAICPASINSELSAATTRILWVNGNLAGWCSGTIVNNTAGDFKPYILSAEHCALAGGTIVPPNDLNRWVFFFNYRNKSCLGPNKESDLPSQQIIGATIRARSDDNGGDFGSDFLLLELDQNIPDSFSPYFAGWNRSGLLSSQGDCFHHPAGDAQMLSIYREKPSLSSFGGRVLNTHLNVFWQENTYGFGTTEGGSSGSSLLDSDGLIIGTLTGGSSSCQQTELSDLYGRFAYSWKSNGSEPSRQLAPWLDPLNRNNLRLKGLNYGDSISSNTLGNISLFPNPVQNGSAEIKGFSELQEPVEMVLYSLAGEELQEKYKYPFSDGTIPLTLKALQGGLYILKVRQASNTKTIKIWIL